MNRAKAQEDCQGTREIPRRLSEKRAGTALHGGPEAKPRELGMTVPKPLELPPGFLQRACAIRKVTADLAIAVQKVQGVEVAWLQVPK